MKLLSGTGYVWLTDVLIVPEERGTLWQSGRRLGKSEGKTAVWHFALSFVLTNTML